MRRAIIWSVVLVCVLSACRATPTGMPDATVPPVRESTSVSSSPLPFESPAGATDPFGSPVGAQAEIPEIRGPMFAIDRPVESGAMRLTGQGPAGIAIVVVDVTMTGMELGQGFIDEQGRFDIPLSSPLVEGRRIGLMAGATEPMTTAEAQALLAGLARWKGEGARDLPFIGMLFDTALVGAP